MTWVQRYQQSDIFNSSFSVISNNQKVVENLKPVVQLFSIFSLVMNLWFSSVQNKPRQTKHTDVTIYDTVAWESYKPKFAEQSSHKNGKETENQQFKLQLLIFSTSIICILFERIQVGKFNIYYRICKKTLIAIN